jgi:uncharacterized protein
MDDLKKQYRAAARAAWSDGLLSPDELSHLDQLQGDLQLSDEDCELIDKSVFAGKARRDVVADPARAHSVACESRSRTIHGQPTRIETPALAGSERSSVMQSGAMIAGRYHVLECVGRGGMGDVYKVKDSQLRDVVALKVISPKLAQDSTALELLRSEVRMCKSLTHPGVIRVHDFMTDDEVGAFYTMEYFEGETLRQWLEGHAGGPTDLDKVRTIMSTAANALAYVHGKQRAHLDVKPENLMINADLEVRLLDFGIGKAVTSSGAVVDHWGAGTPYYMAPEQERVGAEVGLAADIYALGAILYEVITRVPPRGRFQEVHRLRPEVPMSWSRLISNALSPDPASRPVIAEVVKVIANDGIRLSLGARRDSGESLAELKRRATLADEDAWFDLGMHHFDALGEDYDPVESVRLFRLGADKLHASAVRQLGRCFEEGRGLDQDLEKASEMYGKAAAHGDADALFRYGHCLEHGVGQSVNTKRAADQYRMAAERGQLQAILRLSSAFERGDLPPLVVNYDKALEWLRIGVDMGSKEAMWRCGNVLLSHHDDAGAALDVWKSAAQLGHVDAMVQLARCLLEGLHGPKDVVVAWTLLEDASRLGSAEAMMLRARSYESGDAADVDLPRALDLYRAAAALGNVRGQYHAGRLEVLLATDRDEALAGLLRVKDAADQEDAEAMRRLPEVAADFASKAGDSKGVLEFLLIAAEAGIAIGQYRYGFALLQEDGQQSEGIQWIERAAVQGWADAQFALASWGDVIGAREAERWLQSALQNDHAEAQLLVGKRKMAEGDGEADIAEGMRLIEAAARAGSIGAAYEYAMVLERGDEASESDAIEWMRQAAERGNVMAMLQHGLACRDGQVEGSDLEESRHWLTKAATNGSAAAMHELASVVDEKSASMWVERAALAGHAEAQFKSAIRTDVADVSACDRTEWLRRAAAQGHAAALRSLAQDLLTQADLGKEDLPEALSLLARAVSAGDALAGQLMRDTLAGLEHASQGSGEQWRAISDAAHVGVDTAQYLMGRACEDDSGGNQNVQDALGWYRQAADQGYGPAQLEVARILMSGGSGVPCDRDGGLLWLEKAAESDVVEAQFLLGMEYTLRSSESASKCRGVDWLMRAAGAGHIEASYEVGRLFSDEQLVARAMRTARRFFSVASAAGHVKASICLARLLIDGVGGGADPETGIAILKQRASEGIAEAIAAYRLQVVLRAWRIGPWRAHAGGAMLRRARGRFKLRLHRIVGIESGLSRSGRLAEAAVGVHEEPNIDDDTFSKLVLPRRIRFAVAAGEVFSLTRPLLDRSILLDWRNAAWMLRPKAWGEFEMVTACFMMCALLVILMAMLV